MDNQNKQNNGNFNLGKLVGSLGKFKTMSKSPKKGVPFLKFQLSTRDNLGNYHNVPLVSWGKEAQALDALNFQDFIEVQYSLSSSKVQLANGHSLNVPEATVYKHKMLKPANK